MIVEFYSIRESPISEIILNCSEILYLDKGKVKGLIKHLKEFVIS